MPTNPLPERDEIREILEAARLSGYYDSAAELDIDGIQRGPDDWLYVDVAAERIHHHTQIAQVRYALEVLKEQQQKILNRAQGIANDARCNDIHKLSSSLLPGRYWLLGLRSAYDYLDAAIQAQQSSLSKLIGEKDE